MSAWAKPGVKCVCIKRSQWRAISTGALGAGPVFKEICTITAKHMIRGGLVGIEVAGHNDIYIAANFRPLVPPKTLDEDLAAFRDMLVNKPHEVDA